MANKRIKDLATTITDFRTGDVIPVDGQSGTAKMSKDDLLRVTAENALGSIHSLSDTATEDDLKSDNYFALDGGAGKKKLPAGAVATASVQNLLPNSLSFNLSYVSLFFKEFYSVQGEKYRLTIPSWLMGTIGDTYVVFIVRYKGGADIVRYTKAEKDSIPSSFEFVSENSGIVEIGIRGNAGQSVDVGVVIVNQVLEQNVALANSNKTRIDCDEKGIIDNSVFSFVRGRLVNGQVQTDMTYRISSDAIYTATYDTVIKIAAGYKFSLHYFVGGVFSSSTPWITADLLVPSGTSFKVMIATNPEPEGPKPDADIPTFSAAFNVLNETMFLATPKTLRNTFFSSFEERAIAGFPRHDSTWVQDTLWAFNKPSDGGDVKLYNSEFILLSQFEHNFQETYKNSSTHELECKSVDYAYGHLLIGNGSSTYSADDSYLYIFNDFLSWVSKGETIDFSNCGVYSKIDITDLGEKVYGFWAPNKDQIFVVTNRFKDVYLLQLGRQWYNLGQGSFTSTSDENKYNGSYKILKHWEQKNFTTEEFGPHGGQYYKGALYLVNNDSTKCEIYKAILNDDGSLQFDVLQLAEYDEQGRLTWKYIDGLSIRNGMACTLPLIRVDTYVQDGNEKILLVDVG